jgi:hypothetical protein
MEEKFPPGTEVSFYVPDYGTMHGTIDKHYVSKEDGTSVYTVVPRNSCSKKLCRNLYIVVLEENLIITPF